MGVEIGPVLAVFQADHPECLDGFFKFLHSPVP